MHFSRLAATSALLSAALAFPLVVHPGNAKDLVITKQDTINSTSTAHPSPNVVPQAQYALPLELVNNFSGGSINAYVTALDSNGVTAMLQPNGQWFYPNANGATTPQPIDGNVVIPLGGQGSTTSVTIPTALSSARVWFAEGNLQFFVVTDANGANEIVEPSQVNPQDPSADVNWGFVELTNGESGCYANLSYVDFVGLPLGMTLQGSAGTQNVPGLPADAVSSLCNSLNAANSAAAPWGELCVTDSNGTPIRVLSPNDYISVSNNAFSGYYQDYVDQVWNQFTNSPLTINTQEAAGDVNCQVSNGELQCDGDNRGYAQPTSADIFSCNSGPFAIEAGDNAIHYAVVPRLCAAFDRSTFFVSGGNVQPGPASNEYYTVTPTNLYSKFVHELETNGIGYAFPYDDVNPSGAPNESGEVVDSNPSSLTVRVGG